MFELSFKTQLAVMYKDKLNVDSFWDEIQKEYSQKSRYYHNISHLDNLIRELIDIKDQIMDWQVLIFSIAYHDIIYNTLKTDNEQKSAAHAYKKLTELSIPELQKNKCVNQILATKSHDFSKDGDTNFFTDADISILGADNEQYLRYSLDIRKEYKFYPNIVYNPGRQKVLRHFLNMPTIYKTNYFRDKYEKQARKNLSTELEKFG